MAGESVRWPPDVVAGFLALVGAGANATHYPNPRSRSGRGGNRLRSATGYRMMRAAKEGR